MTLPARIERTFRAFVGLLLCAAFGSGIAMIPQAHAVNGPLPARGLAADRASTADGGQWLASRKLAREEGRPAAAVNDDEKMKLAKRLIDILGYARNYDKRVDRAMALTYQALRKKYARNPKLVRILRDLLMEVRQDMLERRQEYFNLMAGLYAKGMDREVLSAAIGFYSSPQGQAFLRQNARVRRLARVMAKDWVKSMMKQAIRDILKKARQRGIEL